MAPLPIFYRKSSDNVINSYNFTDVISGVGYARYYAGKAKTNYLLTSTTYTSDTKYTQATTTETSFTKIIDLDFDIILTQPLVLSGMMLVNASFAISSGGGPGTSSAYLVVKLRKYSGTTETEIANSANSTTLTNSGDEVYQRCALDFSVPQTSYGIGDRLRITIEGYALNSGGTATMKLAHDPDGFDLSWGVDHPVSYPSTLITLIPIKIDL